MKIADVIGKVTLSECHPSIRGGTWLLAVPLSQAGIHGETHGRGEPFVVYDEWGADVGSRIAVTEGAEATAPFYPDPKPIDAYNAAILDTVDIG